MNPKEQLFGTTALAIYAAKKILMKKRFIIAVLVIIFVASIMGYASTQDVEKLDDGTNFMDILILFFFMPVMAMIYGSSVIRDEIEDNSITQVVTSPLERILAYIGYYAALVISLSVIMILITTAGFLSFFIPLGVNGEALNLLGDMIGLVVIGSAVYSSLFLMISVILERPIYFGLFFAFIWEGFIGSLPGNIQKIAFKHYIRSIGSKWIEYGGISDYSDATGVGLSFQLLVIVTLLLLIMGCVLFKTKEFP